MITVEDKLDIFNKLIYKNEEEKCIKEVEILEEKIKKTIEEKKKELEKKKAEFIERKIQLANIKKNEMITTDNENKKESLLRERERLLQDTIKSLEIKAKGFVQSNGYDEYLIKRISKVLEDIEEEKIVLLLNNGDINRFQNTIDELQHKYNKIVTIAPSKTNIIGGFMIKDIDETYNLDYSFMTTIEENKYEIGKKLFSLLENAGDLNG